ncbi:MAG: nucleotidyltransferase, partial [Candidatus Delongbacteria bacterium]
LAMNNIIEYIESKYTPIAIIVYGSYCDGTNNESSDFDALVISDNHVKFHDLSFVDGVQLDLFIYPKEFFDKPDDFSDFMHIYYSDVVKDTNNYGENLKRNIVKYVDSLPNKTDVELLEGIAWCQKMLKRSKQNDIEGMFRWHWLLTESLSIFCQLKHKQYFGPKLQ